MRMIACLLLAASVAYGNRGVMPGIEVLSTEQRALVQGKRVGLITNHSGIDRRARHTIDVLAAIPGVKLTALFAPEHGIRGMVQAGGAVVDSRDKRTGAPIYSIYGKTHRPTEAMLANVDVLVYDIQDVGARFYTYISTMGECMEAAADRGIPFIVLDRPDPIGGLAVEGPILDTARFKSFVGAYPIPVRYGLTTGELAGFIKSAIGKDVKLSVVRMKGYKRGMWYDQTSLPWVAPSPNIPSTVTAAVYPGMCLFEGTNISEGRGTTQPFEMIGAPWIDGEKLAHDLAALNLPGVLFRPASFTPTFSKYKGEGCQGIQVHIVDRNRYQPLRVALHVLEVIRRNHADKFEWGDSFDRLIGTDAVRKAMDQGTPVEQIAASWSSTLSAWDSTRRKFFLYR
jgi:uncharacterized protein YbbC (DUF1343 family)